MRIVATCLPQKRFSINFENMLHMLQTFSTKEVMCLLRVL